MPADAGVIVGATRVIYRGQDKEASFFIKNTDSVPFVVQAWVDATEGRRQFILTPPLSRLDPGRQNTLRVFHGREPLPTDRESMFWLNVKEIPEAPAKPNVLQLAVHTRIKLFYRPVELKGEASDAAAALQWKVCPDKNGNQSLRIHNSTPYYVTFGGLQANGQRTEDLDKLEYVPPYGDAQVQLPSGLAGKSVQVTYTTINDFGGTSSPATVLVSP